MKKNFPQNPLIPMMAITGDLSREQIEIILRRYLEKGITQFLMYPRDGCDVPYMSERWLTICQNFIETAAALEMNVWLYDEFNWPSGTCYGKVLEENPEYAAHCIKVENGVCKKTVSRFPDGRIPQVYTDILNPEVTDCFIRLTHEVYYRRFAQYFGNVIVGIFSDEPSFLHYAYTGGYPYFKDAEVFYMQKTGRDLWADMITGEEQFLCDYYDLLGERFREVYVTRIADWCKSHNILMTGHLMSESRICDSVNASGNAIRALRKFSLPGMDEIPTRTSIDTAEWLTFGTVQAAIRESEHGGLVETFALGPTDLPPSRVEQMIWLEAMFNIDHYLLAVAAVDARGNIKKSGWYNPMCYTNPWFEGYSELGMSATEAASYARKTIAADVYIRFPVKLTQKYMNDKNKRYMTQERLNDLLCELTRAQYQWLLIDEEEEVPEGTPVLVITDENTFSVTSLIDSLSPRRRRITTLDGKLPDDIFLREFTDGSIVVLDLKDSAAPRHLRLEESESTYDLLLNGRGHCCLSPEKPIASMFRDTEKTYPISPVFRLSLDHPNTLRCSLWRGQLSYTFLVEEELHEIRLLSRCYHPGGQLTLDGKAMSFTNPADALMPGLSELYRSSATFTLLPGEHTIAISEIAQSEIYLPSCFICGNFGQRNEENTDILFRLPQTVSVQALHHDLLPQYAGRITYETMLDIPENVYALELDSSDLYTRVSISGTRLNKQEGWNRWLIPKVWRGQRCLLRIEQFTSIAPIFGSHEKVPFESYQADWFPRKYKKCGIVSIQFIGF